LPVTCYLTSSVIGNDMLIWVNELNWFLHRHRALAMTRNLQRLGVTWQTTVPALIATLIERFDADLIAGLMVDLRSATGVDPSRLARAEQLHLDWEQIHEMASAGVSFGNHTVSHPPLARVPLDACRDELRVAASVLEHLPGAATTLAYPFGSHDDQTRRIAQELGHCSLLEVEGVNSPFDATRIGRIKVGAHSAAVLFARMEVVEPLKAALKRMSRAVFPRSSHPRGSARPELGLRSEDACGDLAERVQQAGDIGLGAEGTWTDAKRTFGEG
jgi:hypothetical protein